MSLAGLVSDMRAAGCSMEQIEFVLKAQEERQAAQEAERLARARDANRERQARFRANHNAGNGVMGVTGVTVVTPNPSRTHAFSVDEEVRLPPQTATLSSAPKGAERAKRIPDDWSPNENHRAKAVELGVDEAWLAEIAEEFTNYWRAEAGVKSRKLNWDLVFSNRLNDQAKRGRRGKPPPKVVTLTRNGKPSIQDFARAQDERLNGSYADDRRGDAGEVRPLLGWQLPIGRG